MEDLNPEMLRAVERLCDPCDLDRVCLNRCQNLPCYREVRRGTAYTMPIGRSQIRRDIAEAVRVAFVEEAGGRVIRRHMAGRVDYAVPNSKPVLVDGLSPFV